MNQPTIKNNGILLYTAALCLSTLLACAGASKNYYRSALTAQEQCCHQLGIETQRDNCIRNIHLVENPDVEKINANQETFRCVQQHFECNPRSGYATQESAQNQFDCIQKLPG